MKNIILSLLIIILFSGCKQANERIHADFLIQNVSIVDVKNGQLQTNRYVAIKGDKIIAIYDNEVVAGDSTHSIDGSGKYLIPGLWDMHTHYGWIYTFSNPLLVAHGITGVREMWGDMNLINKVRSKIKKVNLIAPDIYSSGSIIDGTPPVWEGSAGVGTVDEAIAEVDKQIAEGVDFLKIYSRLTKETFTAIAERSKEKGVPFAGHIPNTISIWEAMEADQQSAEHLLGLLKACTSNPKGFEKLSNTGLFSTERSNYLVDSFSLTRFDSVAKALAESNTWLCPTLIVLKSISILDDTTLYTDPRLEYVPEFLAQFWDPQTDFRFQDKGKDYYEASRKEFNHQLSLMGSLEKAGVKIVAGTDFGNPYVYPGFSLHDELQLMVEGGMSPAGALRAATYNPALLMGKESNLGQVSVGQFANLVLLNGNPLEDIQNTRQIYAVLLRGNYMDRTALDSLMEKAKEISTKMEGPIEN